MEAKQATLHHELIAQLLDSRIPKTEREHAAAREIERLRAALLQEFVDAPETEPVARVTGYYGGYLSIVTVDGRVLPAGTALYAAPPHQSEHHLEMVNTPAPSVPDVLPATNPSQISSSAEPFGYFKAEPFGWTDCAETDDGAIALYTAPPAPSVPDGWIRAVDEAMVVHHIGIADRADSYEVAKKKLNALLAINSDIARDFSEAPADVARDAERWQMLPAFLAEFQVPYLRLVDKIDAAIEREILGGQVE